MIRKMRGAWALTLLLMGGLMIGAAGQAVGDDAVYEMRTYTTHPGKLDDLHARFRDHTVKIFAKHGMESIAYWVPTDGEQSKNTLIYIIKHASRDAAAKSWQAFREDPDWQKARAESEADGPILSKRPESVYMAATDYSPKLKPEAKSEGADGRVYELRIYTTNPGKLDDLNARFRDHTIEIFNKYGLKSFGYFTPTDGDTAQNTLIYILEYKDRDAAAAGWKSFFADPDWKSARAASEAAGPILVKGGVKSVYMKATDYSPAR